MITAANTSNPLGERPLNFMAHGLAGLGDNIGPTLDQASGTVDASQQTSWYNVLSYLQAWNATLKAVEAEIAQHAFDSSYSSLAHDALTSRQNFNYWAEQFTTIYRAVYGEVPAGLSAFDPITAVAAATLLSAILIAAVAGYNYSLALRDRAAAQRQQQQTAGAIVNQAATLRQQAAQATANGDNATAAALNAQADALTSQATGLSTTATSLTAWFQQNAKWIGIGAIAIVALPPLIKKI